MPPTERSSTDPASRPPASTVAATILVVDDDPGLRQALHLILDDEWEVIEAVNGFDALAVLASKKVDLVLLDLLMTRGDGFDVLEKRRDEHKSIPIIVLSALNTAWTAAAAMRLGAVDYVTKPFDESTLRALIGETLRSSDRLRQSRSGRAAGSSRILLLGVALGIHASLTILLRDRCRIERAETFGDTIAYSNAGPPSVVVVDLASIGQRPAEALGRIRAQVPNARLIVIGAADQLDSATRREVALLLPSARVSDLLREIGAHVGSSMRALPRFSPRVVAILDYLSDHHTVASVRRIGRAVAASPYYLSTLFRGETGMTLRVYINELRVEVAKWLLLETSDKVEAVAARVGLHDASHLSRLFLKYTGDRPGTFRPTKHR